MDSGGGARGDGSDGHAATVPAVALDETTPASGDASGAPAARAAATTIGRYHIVGELGAGGMGVVYRARDPELDRALAIKVVRPRLAGTEARARLLREAQAMAKLRHGNVVPIFDVGLADAGVFVVMPLLEGGTLGAWLRAERRPWRDVLDRFVAAGRGLVAAHAAGLVHRDFKPDNVLLGDGAEVQVADFGLARIAAAADTPRAAATDDRSLDLTRTGDLLGTPAYMAPEQLRSEPSDARGDQFSFCVALWEGLYGARPFDAGNARGPAALTFLLDAITEARIAAPARSDVPAWLRTIVLRGLHADPAQRWPSMQALLAEIDRRRAPRRRRWPIALVTAVVVAAIASALLIATWREDEHRPASSQAAPEPVSRMRRLTHSGGVWGAQISPDGTIVAMNSAGALILRGVDENAVERVLVASGVLGFSWSPDGDQLLVGLEVSDTKAHMTLVDVTSARQTPLGESGGRAVFASNTEFVALDSRTRALERYALSDPSTPIATCPITETVTVLKDLAVARETGTAVLMAGTADAKNVLIAIDPDCRRRGNIVLADRIDAFNIASSGDALLVLTTENGLGQITKYSLDGNKLGPDRNLGIEALGIVGEVGDRLYVLTGEVRTILQLDRRGAIESRFETRTKAEFEPSPDGTQIAWIEGINQHGGGDLSPGPLRVTTIADIARRGPALLSNARTAGWSPDGSSIAAVVEQDDRFTIVTVAVATGEASELTLEGFYHGGAPVWLDDHRVAAIESNMTGIGWVDVRTGEIGRIEAPGPGRIINLRQSPRDARLALTLRNEDLRRVWLITSDGVPHKTAIQLGEGEWTVWSPGGELILVNESRGTLERVDPQTGTRGAFGRFSSPKFLDAIRLLPDEGVLLTSFAPVYDLAVLEPQ